jgi:hypothetical protein
MILTSAQESPVSLPKFQMASRLESQYPLGPRKEPKYTVLGVYGHFYMCPAKRLTVILMSTAVPEKEALLQNGEKHAVTVHGAPRGQKSYVQWCAALFPKGYFPTFRDNLRVFHLQGISSERRLF